MTLGSSVASRGLLFPSLRPTPPTCLSTPISHHKRLHKSVGKHHGPSLAMDSGEARHGIQRAIESRSADYEFEERSKTRDIQQAVSPAISDEAERAVRASGQDLISENLDPTGKHYPFRILQSNKHVERVVVDWFMVSSQHSIIMQDLSISKT